MSGRLTVGRVRRFFAVFDADGQQVSCAYSNRAQAEERRFRMEKPKIVKRRRPCMCCGAVFISWGIGNRLCERCRCPSLDRRMIDQAVIARRF